MFSNWLFARLNAAEKALADGRIDEAYDVAVRPDVREHRRGQKLLDALVKPLLARARLHAQAGRYREALSDLERLEAVGRGEADARALRERVEAELRERVARQADRRDAFAEAKDKVQAGRLDSGRIAIERVEDAAQREQLKEALDVRVERAEQLLEQARQALARGDVAAACRGWDEALGRHGRTQESDTLAGQLVAALATELNHWFEAGRLDRIITTLRSNARLCSFNGALAEFERIAALLSQAATQLASGRQQALRESLLRLRAARPETPWLEDALRTVGSIIDQHERQLASPLGLLELSGERMPGIGTPEPRGSDDTADVRAAALVAAPMGPALRAPLLMLVDGTGSSLLVASDAVRIGRASGDREIDVPIPAELQSHHADLLRDGEDYFLMAHGACSVNGRSVRRTLLRDGDRIVLGSAAKLTFHKPSGMSASAVLRLSDRFRLPQDVSQVVLFHDTCLIGPQSSCHVRTREGDARVVVFDRQGQLCLRSAALHGRGVGRAEPVVLNETHEVGDLRVTFKIYQPADAGQHT